MTGKLIKLAMGAALAAALMAGAAAPASAQGKKIVIALPGIPPIF